MFSDISSRLGLLTATAFLCLPSAAGAQSFNLAGGSGSISKSYSVGWNVSSPDLGPGVTCVGCGVPLVPDTYYGWDLYLSSSGGLGITGTASASIGNLTINPGATTATVTAQTASGYGPGVNYVLNGTYNQGYPSFTQTASAGASLSANFNFSNSLSGQFCAIECGSFGTSLGSTNVSSFTPLSFTTAGSGTVSAFGVPVVSGVDGQTESLSYGSVSLNAPNTLNGSLTSAYGYIASATNKTTVGTLNVDLANIASKAGKLGVSLNGSYGVSGLGSLSYNLLTADLKLSESLTQTTSVEVSQQSTVQFFNKEGDPIALEVWDPDTGTYDQSYTSYLSFNGTVGIDTGGANLAGDYGVVTTQDFLLIDQSLTLGLSGDLDVSALAGSAFGDGFGPLYSKTAPLFDNSYQIYSQYTEEYLPAETETFDFPAAAAPEPSTWALLLVGFAALGVGARARRRAHVAAI